MNMHGNRTLLKYLACVVSACIMSMIGVQNTSARNAGASFLNIAPGARAIGMGGAFTAVADDVSAVYWNPGGLAYLTNRELSGTHADWLAGMSYDFVAYAHPHAWGTFSWAVAVLNSGSMEYRDETGQKGSDFESRDMAISCGYARKINSITSIGINLKYIRQEIETEKALGYAVDVGGKVLLPGSSLSLGYGIFNLGPRMKFISESYSLPMRYTLGLGYSIGGMLFACDVNHDQTSRRTYFSLGSEYQVLGAFALRLGYLNNALDAAQVKTGTAQDVLGLRGIRGGFGLSLFGNQMDYAFVPYGELGATHRISFTSKF